MKFDRALAVGLVPHTVEVQPGRFVAGHLIRRAGRAIGYVYQIGTSWQWQTEHRTHYGERSSLNAALTALVDIANLPAARPALADYSTSARRAPLRSYEERQRRQPAEAPALAPRAESIAAPAPAPRAIVWADINAADLRTAIARQLDKHK